MTIIAAFDDQPPKAGEKLVVADLAEGEVGPFGPAGHGTS